MKSVNFKLPDRAEWGLFILAGLFLILFDYTQNMFQAHSDLYYKTIVFGISAIALFWSTFILYHAVLFIAYFRAIRKKGTHYYWDWIFGSLLFVGMFFLLVGGIGAMYYTPQEALPFFFNIGQITVYHFGGVILQLIGLGYFMITE
jgi:hypothetical protein